MTETNQSQTQINSDSGPSMGFFDHIDELRVRLMRCLYIFMAGFAISYFWLSEHVLEFLRKPLFKVLPIDQQKLYFTSLFENFMTHIKVSGYVALMVFMPLFFLQLWGFIAPGLYPRERRLVVPFVVATGLFFSIGAAFAYFGLFPIAFKYFVQYGGPTDVPLLTIDQYYGTCLKLMLLFGLCFDFPVVLVLFGMLGIVTPDVLRAQRRNAILGITVLSALFAPPDAISMLLLMAPLILLYEGSIGVMAWMLKKGWGPEVPSHAANLAEEPDPLAGRSI